MILYLNTQKGVFIMQKMIKNENSIINAGRLSSLAFFILKGEI